MLSRWGESMRSAAPSGLARRAQVIQRQSGSLLCTGCGAMQHPQFPAPAADWVERVRVFEAEHSQCGRTHR